MIVKPFRVLIPFAFLCAIAANLHASLELKKGDHISLVGSGMGSRMVHYGHFETEIQLRFPSLNLTIRNLCDEGNFLIQAIIGFTTCPWTSVKRKYRPWYLKVSLSWSMPNKCRMVAWKSCT